MSSRRRRVTATTPVASSNGGGPGTSKYPARPRTPRVPPIPRRGPKPIEANCRAPSPEGSNRRTADRGRPPRRCRYPASPITSSRCPCPIDGASSIPWAIRKISSIRTIATSLKADKPVHGDWFFNVGLFSDTVYDARDLPSRRRQQLDAQPRRATMSSAARDRTSSRRPWRRSSSTTRATRCSSRRSTSFASRRSSTSITLSVARARGGQCQSATTARRAPTSFVGIQAAFVDKHLRNVSDRFDFDSIRVGIQPFSSDFRGFLFQDNQLGVRLFGTRNNNVFQYNLAYFRRIEKDTNSGLNAIGPAAAPRRRRRGKCVLAGYARQRVYLAGHVVYNRNREGNEPHYDSNGFIVRPAALGIETPRNYDVVYFGYNGDGHFGRMESHRLVLLRNRT